MLQPQVGTLYTCDTMIFKSFSTYMYLNTLQRQDVSCSNFVVWCLQHVPKKTGKVERVNWSQVFVLIGYKWASPKGSVVHKQGWGEEGFTTLWATVWANSPAVWEQRFSTCNLKESMDFIIYCPKYDQQIERIWRNLCTSRPNANTGWPWPSIAQAALH